MLRVKIILANVNLAVSTPSAKPPIPVKNTSYMVYSIHIFLLSPFRKEKCYHQACSKQINGGARHEFIYIYCEYQGTFTSAYTHVHHYSEAPQHTQYMFYTSEHETSYRWRIPSRIAMRVEGAVAVGVTYSCSG